MIMIERAFPSYKPPDHVCEIMSESKILDKGETPQDMLKRVVNTVFDIEKKYNTPDERISQLKQEFAQCMAANVINPGTLINAGRLEYRNACLSSCVVAPVDLREKDNSRQLLQDYYHHNMGSGFDLTPYENPVELLICLNQFCAQQTASGLHDRYIGNIALLNVAHPEIISFIQVKETQDLPYFNISVVLSEEFMQRVSHDRQFRLTDGSSISAQKLLEEMAKSAWATGDPGIVYLDRLNTDNPIPEISPYSGVPPCCEMGLSPGETCVFGYINLLKFLRPDGQINYEELEQVVFLLTRALDNGVELSLNNYPHEQSEKMARLKRRIGVSVCGLADLLLSCDLAYDSEEGKRLAHNILSFIQYTSMKASVQLAEEKGSCGAMDIEDGNGYVSGEFIEHRLASQQTNTVPTQDWLDLANKIRQTRSLRNISTTALPPSGRSAILLGVNPSIEPFLGIADYAGSVRPAITRFVKTHSGQYDPENILEQATIEGTFQNTALSDSARLCLRTATEIPPQGQLEMVAVLAGLNGVFTSSASKTVNLPESATVEDILGIFRLAHSLGLKNVAVYRDKSKLNQPIKL